jgi:hypothetical protein
LPAAAFRRADRGARWRTPCWSQERAEFSASYTDETAMQATSAIDKRPRHAAASRRRRWAWFVGAPVAVILLLAVAILGHFLDEPMRQRIEAAMNQKMSGYTVRLPRLDFHPVGGSVTLYGLTITQAAHPKPPVVEIEKLHAGVHWRALLHLRLVADFIFTHPKVHINRPQLMKEATDKVPVEDKGWQDALEAIYPLKINEFRVKNGEITYIDDDPKRPMQISQLDFLATNIRNVSSPENTYPSPIWLNAVIFDKGKLHVEGDANFLQEPYAGSRVHVDLRNVPLEKVKPAAVHANVHISGGTLAVAEGDIEYSPKVQDIKMREIRIDDVAVDYVHSPQTQKAEEKRMDAVKDKADELNKRSILKANVDRFTVHNGTFGYVDETTNPKYRVSLDAANIDVRDITNRSDTKPVKVNVTGLLDASGKTNLTASFLPRQSNPEMELALQIEGTEMRAMNDLFRAYGNFDVAQGQFSFYSELQIKDGRIDGYVKPLFSNLDVYDREQDKDKNVFQQIYEGIVGGVGTLLENRREAVATQADVTGAANSPKLSTWQVVVNLVTNAFFKAILPGLEHALRGGAAGNAPAPAGK